MNSDFLGTIKSFRITSRKQRVTDDDLVDRLNHYYTSILIIVFSIILCAKQYIVGEPLQCWVPAQFRKAWEQYAENYCWVQNTYFVSPNESFPLEKLREERELQYYQWVPFVMALQAFFFFLPILFWRTVNWQSGVSIKDLISMCNKSENISPDKRRENMKVLARHMVYCLTRARRQTRAARRYITMRLQSSEFYLIAMYLITKFLFIVNVVVQFFFLDWFLGSRYSFYGFNIFVDLMRGKSWQESGHFPHVTYCDFDIRDFGQSQKYTIQCVLVINIFNEKIFLFLWFWFVAVLLVNIYSFCKWCYWITSGQKESDVGSYLKIKERKSVKQFLGHMKRDCVLVLRIIKENCGIMVIQDLVEEMYHYFQAEAETLPKPFNEKENQPLLKDEVYKL